MDARRHVRLMADYNRWMNRRITAAAAGLAPQALAEERGAPHGSILGTLNHQAVCDSIWLRRFEAPGHWARLEAAATWLPEPSSARDTLAADLPSYCVLRERLDDLLVAWCGELIFNDLDRVLSYRSVSGETRRRQVGPLLSHLFNQQTHLRGQATTLMTQAGVDPGCVHLTALPGFDPFSAVPDDAADEAAAPSA